MKYAVIIFIVVSLIACRKEIPFDVKDSDRKIVLNTIIQADSLFSAHVFRSNHVYDHSFELLYLNNAIVSVYTNNKLIENLSLVENGYYLGSGATANANTEYEFRVSVPNLQSCTGVGKVLKPVNIIAVDSIGLMNFEYDEFFSSYEETYQAYEVKFNDNGDEENYYRLKVDVADYNLYNTEYDFFVPNESNDAVIEVWPYFDGYYYFSDVLFNGDDYSFTLGLMPPYGTGGYNACFYLEHISKDFFLYIKSANFQRETKGDALFAQSVQVLSNINNGYGIVGTSTVSKKQLTIYGNNQTNEPVEPIDPVKE